MIKTPTTTLANTAGTKRHQPGSATPSATRSHIGPSLRPAAAALLALSALYLGGCSTTRTREDVVKDQLRAEQAQARAQAEQLEQQQAKIKKEIEAVPRWALQAPRPDATGIYAVGMAQSDQLVIALRKATLEAEFGLAKLYGQELSGSERSYAQEAGTALTQQYTGLIDKLVARVPVVGFEVVEQSISPIGGRFHAWIMLKLPYTQFNKVLQEQKSQSQEPTVKAAFDDLERRLLLRQAQRRKDSSPPATAPSNQASATAGSTASSAPQSSPARGDAGEP